MKNRNGYQINDLQLPPPCGLILMLHFSKTIFGGELSGDASPLEISLTIKYNVIIRGGKKKMMHEV